MWWTITLTLLLLWGVGLASSYTIGGFTHILLILAFIVILLNLLQGRRPI
ncbi:lmo0937 family membrane protein [Desulfogranum marinum]|nr:lmo0937 family membrane protein [Desulfogranum marinum]MBM9511914.1 lmo0937 family membrane protein [Desulfogranum marinum]